MRNTITINGKTYTIDMISNENTGENVVALEIENAKGQMLEIGSGTVDIQNDYFRYEIPRSMYTGSGVLQVRILGAEGESEWIKIAKTEDYGGDIYLHQIKGYEFEIRDAGKKEEMDLPIATDEEIGCVKGGENVGVRKDGTVYVDGNVTAESITNLQIDEICT